MVHIASRASWGARFADGDMTLPGLAADVVVHHTVTALLPVDAPGLVGAEQAQMRNIEQIGQNRFGTGISYRGVVIFPSGRAYQGTSWNRRGTHLGGRNSTAVALAFAGNYDETVPSGQAIATAHAIFVAGRGRWFAAGAQLRGHRDFMATACPGRHLYARLGEIRQGGGTTPPTPPPPPGQLVVDGRWGPLTTRRFQQVMGTPQDGVVSQQWNGWRARNPGLTGGWEWVPNPRAGGSWLIRAVQGRIGAQVDGLVGPNTFSAMQRHLGTAVSGEVWLPSPMVRALQTRLNEGRF